MGNCNTCKYDEKRHCLARDKSGQRPTVCSIEIHLRKLSSKSSDSPLKTAIHWHMIKFGNCSTRSNAVWQIKRKLENR